MKRKLILPTTKRFLSITAALVTVFAVSLCLSACGNSRDSNPASSESSALSETPNNSENTGIKGEHVHTYSAWNTSTMPSCSSQGMQARTCSSCGFSEYSPIPALGHTEVVDGEVPATCVVDGKTAGSHCSVCNTIIIEPATLKATGHQYGEGVISTPATCVKDGAKKYTCAVSTCQHTYSETYALPSFTATELYNQSIKYVGEITTYDKQGKELGLGTGFVISSDGEIVTNYHVIEDAYSANITINNTTYTISSVLAYDSNIDLAVLKINASGLTSATVCKEPAIVGSTVYAIGSSRGMTNTYSQGMVAYADRIVSGVSHVQHDASITHGNSGGPLINVYGEVIGINTWGISDSQNLNFAVFAGELDKLVYGTPITLSELFKKHSPYEYLVDWVCDNYTRTYSNGETLSVEEKNDNFIYSISYDLSDAFLYVDMMSDDGEVYFSIDLSGDPSEYSYYFDYDTSALQYNVVGEVNAKTFTDSTRLYNYTYDGPRFNETTAVNLTQTAMSATIAFFRYFLTVNRLDVVIEDFGFIAYV